MKYHVVQSSFLSGVLDPRASARVDTEAYQNGLLVGHNVVPEHLGGVRRRAGLRYRDTLPNILTNVSSAATATAPNGGTANNARDNASTTLLTNTTDVGTTDPFVVVHYDLGSAVLVDFADVIAIKSTGGSSTQFRIQYSTDNVTFTDFGAAFTAVDTTERSYRRAGPVTARYWRVAKVGGTDMGAVDMEIADFTLWQESTTVSEVRLLAFEVSTDDRYVVALTDRCASVYSDTALIAYVPLPYVSADLAELDASADAETMVLVHEDYAPRFLLREGTTNFQTLPITFDNIPTYDFNDASSPTPTSEVQKLTFTAGWDAGNTFQIELEGARTANVVYAGDSSADERTATAANIAREVQKLYTVRAFTGVTCSRTALREFTVTFAAASAHPYELMSGTPIIADSTSDMITVTRTATGVSRAEPVWSATRGYPRTVVFYEGRLFFGGTRSLQQTIFGSVVNNILDFKIGEGLDDEPLFTKLSGRPLNAISGLYAGRSLQMFTTGGEFRFVKAQGNPITPGDAPSNQTQYGCAKIRPVAIDGATLYIQRLGKSVRDFRYDYEEDAYNSLGLSSLAPHLFNDITDLAAWNGSAVDEIGLVFVVNGDGTAAVLNSRREANVTAWTSWDTQGLFKAVAAVVQDVYFATRRTIAGVDRLFLEAMDYDCYTDAASRQTLSDATAITGLSHLNGESCRVLGDGFVLTDVTPAAGAATISRASDAVEIGLNFTPEVTPMPLQTLSRQTGGSTLMRSQRIVSVAVRVRNTLGLLMNGKVLADRKWDVNLLDAAAAVPVTGTFRLEESTNWDESQDKTVSFTQVDPLPMTILSIDVTMESHE